MINLGSWAFMWGQLKRTLVLAGLVVITGCAIDGGGDPPTGQQGRAQKRTGSGGLSADASRQLTEYYLPRSVAPDSVTKLFINTDSGPLSECTVQVGGEQDNKFRCVPAVPRAN